MEGPSTEEFLSLLTPEEREGLQNFEVALKEANIYPENAPPQFLMSFLWSRKLDIKRAVQIFDLNQKVRKALDLPPTRIPASRLNEKLIRSGTFQCFPQTVDKQGRSIAYLFMGNYFPAEFSPDDLIISTFWLGEITAYSQPPSAQRNGMIVVEDLTGVGMRHLDTRFLNRVKEIGGTDGVQNLFPGRFQAVLVLNPPLIFKMLMAIAKLFVKKKLIKRVRVVTPADILAEYVDADNLSVAVGGSFALPWQEYFDRELELARIREAGATPHHE